MRVAVIGLGRMGRFYAQTVASLAPNVHLVSVADPDANARNSVQAALGVPAFAETEAVLQQADVDAVVVATTTSTHADVVIAAAQAGKAIFCEKPLALSIEQTQAALSVVQRAGALLQVGFMRRFDATHRLAKELIDAGRIGRPLVFKSVNRDPSCPPVDFADPARSGGIVVDMGIHDFDLARWLISSEVEQVTAVGSLVACPELERVGDIDTALINLRFASGALGNVEVSRTARYGYDIRAEVQGTNASVRVGSSSTAEDPEFLGPQSAAHDDTPHFIRRFGPAYRAQIEHFIECVQQQRPPLVGGADALAAIKIGHAATRSVHTGVPVKVEA